MGKQKRYKRRDATKPLAFSITAEHVETASCGDPERCVIAQALRASFGDLFENVEVGARYTKVSRADGIKVRYRTGARLRRALIAFDLTGAWDLPEGIYHLSPIPSSEQMGARAPRHDLIKPAQKARSGKKRRKKRAARPPTRKVARCDAVIPE